VGGLGSPGARVVASFEWALEVAAVDTDGDGIPDSSDACRLEKGVRSDDASRNGCPVLAVRDTDGDGIPDDEDACMDVFGKRTNDKRTNGCDDRDRDGIMDPIDACPFEPGPASSDPKKNGCPLPKGPGDRDGDGIKDDVDACPDVVGNVNTNPDLNGCPDPDPDKDGINTDQDACPDMPGKPDSDPTKNGCPDAFIMGKQIRIKDRILFKAEKSAELQPGKDDVVLQAVADLLKAHPEITKVRIESHVDNRGTKKLSETRAGSVVAWLRAHGVDGARLNGVGMGSDKPIEANDSEQGRETNRRVEFYIEAQKDTP
jgi:outer membrane protein OmpA-like peptidoglycan-associated protein